MPPVGHFDVEGGRRRLAPAPGSDLDGRCPAGEYLRALSSTLTSTRVIKTKSIGDKRQIGGDIQFQSAGLQTVT